CCRTWCLLGNVSSGRTEPGGLSASAEGKGNPCAANAASAQMIDGSSRDGRGYPIPSRAFQPQTRRRTVTSVPQRFVVWVSTIRQLALKWSVRKSTISAARAGDDPGLKTAIAAAANNAVAIAIFMRASHPAAASLLRIHKVVAPARSKVQPHRA